MQHIQVIDSHTGGEPTRLVLAGFPDLGSGSMAQRLEVLRRQHDAWRAATVLEPRGSDVVVGALLCPPVDPASAAGVRKTASPASGSVTVSPPPVLPTPT